MKPRTATVVAGLVWLAIGILLLSKGVYYLASAAYPLLATPLLFIPFLTDWVGSTEQAALLVIALALLLGLFKGRMLLAKVARANVVRLKEMGHVPFAQIYPRRTLFIIGAMISLGVILRWAPTDLRGGIDIMVGSGLIHGAMAYGKALLSKVEKSV